MHTLLKFLLDFKGIKISTIAIPGEGAYAEWIISLANAKNAKALIGAGWCGELAESIDIGNIVIPVAAVRDEDVTNYYVDKGFLH